MEYRTIAERCEARFVEKKSEFIGYLAPADSEERAVAFINEIRAMHRKATHNCYAYILRGGSARHSDDGEPSGTAGVPIYEVLRREGLTDVACVVTRYFGGVLLGAGGLVRAYTRGAKDAVDAAKIRVMAMAARLELSLDYSLYGRLPQIFSEFDARVSSEEFADNVRLTLFVREELAERLTEELIDSCNGKIVVECAQKMWFDFA
ncbi:MAG: YigZ family protein [Lachnospiraceae bacterium]|nr:YigZ family protein [Ruminococcus sp.]MCM1275273.1 YigZ family protein [Lachnospiraceae bacterium]